MPCRIKNPANINLDGLEPHVQDMYGYFDKKIGFNRPPTMVFDSDPSNQDKILGKTAYYDPNSMEIHVYTDGRHPKDMLRSIAHELIHHVQNEEGRLNVGGFQGEGYFLENEGLKELELEAYERGNGLFREWEDTRKVKENKTMSLNEWKNNELNRLMMERFGILKEEKENLEELSCSKEQTADRLRAGEATGRLREEEEALEEAKDDCFERESFDGKVECIKKKKGFDEERASAYVASVMRKMGELDEAKDSKPDFLDLDKDGDTEEPMKQAAEQAKEDEEEKDLQEIVKDAINENKKIRLRIK